MENIKPYWFIEAPIDTEHKYYKLMAYLVKVKDSFGTAEFPRYFKHLLTMKKDLISFEESVNLSQRTMLNFTDSEKDIFYQLLDDSLSDIEEVNSIVQNSIHHINQFLDENIDAIKEYDSLADVESYCGRYNLWDQGFLVIRKEGEELLRVFTWFFSIIKVDKEETVGLLMTEMLDPKCKNTKELSKIKSFLRENVKGFSVQHDCILIADVNPSLDIEIGSEIGKEKSVEIILRNFKKS